MRAWEGHTFGKSMAVQQRIPFQQLSQVSGRDLVRILHHVKGSALIPLFPWMGIQDMGIIGLAQQE